MKILYTTLLALSLVLISGTIKSYGQQNTRQLQKHYTRLLEGDSVRSEQVEQIIADYKVSMKLLADNQEIAQETRGEKISALIKDKNRKLRLLLSPAEQEKIIPTTERAEKKPAEENEQIIAPTY